MGTNARQVNVSRLCCKAGVSRQSYYQYCKRERAYTTEVDRIVNEVRLIRNRNPRMGGRKLLDKIRSVLNREGIEIGRDRFFDILRSNSLLVKKKRRYHRTTNSHHHFYKYKNMIRDLPIRQPNEVWVSDLTYIRTSEGFLYLSLVSDLYSRKILGYEVSDNLETIGCLKALKMAFKELPEGSCPVHHSDRGIQYCSRPYVETLREKGINISMTEENHCYENAVAERINGILKDEYLLGINFKTKSIARTACRQAVHYYNTDRPHLSLDMKTPDDVFYAAVKKRPKCY